MVKNNLDIFHFKSLDKIIDFFDTHDLGEYWDKMPEAHFEVGIKRSIHLVAIEPDLAKMLTEIAISSQTLSESLINLWLREKIKSYVGMQSKVMLS
ncbi:MAG: CopG family antitoxin [bacterium]